MHGLLGDVLREKAQQVVAALDTGHGILGEAQVHERAIGGQAVIDLAQRVDDGRGTHHVVATGIGVHGRHVVGDGLAGFTAVKRGVGVHAHGHVGVNRVHAGVELAAAARGASGDVPAVALEHVLEQLVGIVVVVAVVVHLGTVDQSVKLLVALPVVADGGQELGAGVALLVEHELLDGGQRVGAGAHAGGLGPNSVVLGAALGKVVTRLHAVGKEGRDVRQGLALVVRRIDDVQARTHLVGPVGELRIDALEQLIEGLIRLEAARVGAELLTGAQAHAAVQNHLHHLGRIDVGGVVPAVLLARQTDLDTAHHAVIASLLDGHTLAHHALDGRSVVEDLGVTVTGAHALDGLDFELVGGLLVHAHADPRVHHARVGRGLKHKHGEVVGGIVTLGVNAADGEALAAKAAAVAHGHGAGILELGGVVHLDVLDLEQLERKLLGDGTALDVGLVERVEPLIHAAIGDGVAVALDLDKRRSDLEEHKRLPEALGCATRDLVADLGHRDELLAADVVCLLSGLLLAEFGVALDIVLGRLVHDDGGTVPVALVSPLGIAHVERGELLLGLGDDAVVAELHKTRVVDGQVARTGVVVEVGLENLLSHLRALALIVIKARVDAILNGATLPPSAELQDLGALFVVMDIELIMLALLKGSVVDLVDNPVDRELGIDRRSLGRSSDLAQDQVVVVHKQRALVQDLLKGIGALQLAWRVRVLLVGLGHQAQALHVDPVLAVQKRLAQTIDARKRRPILMMHLVAQAIHLVERLGAPRLGVGFLSIESHTIPPYSRRRLAPSVYARSLVPTRQWMPRPQK